MKVSDKGNQKVGQQILTINRPVGDTCPPDCFFLNNGCYADRTEHRWKHTREFSFNNLQITKVDIIALVWKAISTKTAIRIHERGDFFLNNKLDKKYIQAWQDGLSMFKKSELCDIWVYTHVFDPDIASLRRYGIKVYASIHSVEDYKKARKAGFKLFAWVSDLIKSKFKPNTDKPRFIDLPIIGRTLVCPEQRLGHHHTTCSKCKWCVKGKGNVAFMKI